MALVMLGKQQPFFTPYYLKRFGNSIQEGDYSHRAFHFMLFCVTLLRIGSWSC
jgi:hypothetical protein